MIVGSLFNIGLFLGFSLLKSFFGVLYSFYILFRLQRNYRSLSIHLWTFEEILRVSVRITGWSCIVKSIPWLLLSSGITVFDLGFSQFIGLP